MRAVRPRLKPAPVPTIFPSGNAISSPSSSRKNPSRRGAFKKQRRQEVRSYFHAPMTFKNGDYELSRWTKKSRRVKCMYLFCIHGKLPDMEKPFCMAYYQHPHSLFSAIVVVILHMIHIFNFHAQKMQLKNASALYHQTWPTHYYESDMHITADYLCLK